MTVVRIRTKKTTLAVAAVIAVAAILVAPQASARNKPCSGKKGGVSHCHQGKFICQDGSMSQSKKTCSGDGQ